MTLQQDLKQEKELILKLLERHAKQAPTGAEATFEDVGNDETDNVFEVEQYEVNTTLIAELNQRLEQIDQALNA